MRKVGPNPQTNDRSSLVTDLVRSEDKTTNRTDPARAQTCVILVSVHTVVSHLSRWYKTNDRQLWYWQLSHPLFTDKLEVSVKSWFNQNRYSQVFALQLGWVRVYPMKKKSEACEALSLLSQRDGVPPVLIVDGAKEQTMGEFWWKAQEMGVHIQQTEPYSPWQNAAEGAIQELK